MPFGFGGSRSESNSSSSSVQGSLGTSVSGGASASQSQDAVAFEDIFARLFGGAEGTAAGLDPSLLTGAANTLFNSGTSFMSGLGQDAGSQYLTDRLSSDNAVLEDQIGLLGEDLGNFFNEELLPGIETNAIAGGQLGGGRQGVAQGRAIDAVGEQFTKGATALRAGDIAARDAAAGTIAGNNIAGAGTAFAGIPALLGAANTGFGASLAPAERLAAILGGPTVLGSSSASALDFANSFSSSFGRSEASSTSSGRSFSLGFE